MSKWQVGKWYYLKNREKVMRKSMIDCTNKIQDIEMLSNTPSKEILLEILQINKMIVELLAVPPQIYIKEPNETQ